MSLAEVTQKHTPSIQWQERLGAWKLRPSCVIVGQPEFFSALEGLLLRFERQLPSGKEPKILK